MARLTSPAPRACVGAASALLLAGALAGCTGGDDGSSGSSEGGLAGAQSALEETSGVEMSMTTKKLPQGADGFTAIEGTLTDGPAFDGTVKVTVNDIDAKLPMRVVDGAVYAQLPYTEIYSEVDPASYGTFEVAELMDPEHGIAGWLGATEDAEEDGDTVTGTVPGSLVAQLVESADRTGNFTAEYQLEDDRLASATLTGPFYKGAKPVSYTLSLSQYDVNQDIRRPDTAQ